MHHYLPYFSKCINGALALYLQRQQDELLNLFKYGPILMYTFICMVSTHMRTVLPLLLSRFSRVRLCATPWTAAYQAPLSMGFSRQENWSGVPLPSLVFGASLAVKQVRCSHQGRLSNKTVVLIRGDQDTDGPRGKVM